MRAYRGSSSFHGIIRRMNAVIESDRAVPAAPAPYICESIVDSMFFRKFSSMSMACSTSRAAASWLAVGSGAADACVCARAAAGAARSSRASAMRFIRLCGEEGGSIQDGSARTMIGPDPRRPR
jgi:hypothetical protein